jgi:NADH:ubiquinone oxidoreductase subunit 2 (subunit N)
MVFVASANFYGHRASAMGSSLAVSDELRWATEAADRALAAGLALVGVSVVASFGVAAVVFAAGDPARVGLDDSVRGLVRRRPTLGVSLLLAAATLAGVPPTPGFFAYQAALRSLAEHSALAWLVPVWAALWVASAVWFVRLARLALDGRGTPGPAAPRSSTPAVLVAAVLVAGTLAVDAWWWRLVPPRADERRTKEVVVPRAAVHSAAGTGVRPTGGKAPDQPPTRRASVPAPP